MSNFIFIIKAWKYLFSKFVIFLLIGYALSLILIMYTGVEPTTVFKTVAIGPKVTYPLIEKSFSNSMDPAIILFLNNSCVALCLMSILFVVPLFNPNTRSNSPSFFKKQLIKGVDLKFLYPLRSFRTVCDKRLRPVYFCLFILPVLAMMSFGLIVGSLMATGHIVLDSLAVVMACIIPHGIFEISALVLGTSIPLSAYFIIKNNLENGDTESVFCKINSIIFSKRSWLCMGFVFLLLAMAAFVEGHLTEHVVSWYK